MELGFLNEQIVRRKSVRHFDMDRPVSEELIEELVDFLSELHMPQDDIDWNFDTLPYRDMVSIATVEPGLKAPMYLVLRAEKLRFCLQNTGYLGELAALWLCSKGIATCWQGGISVNEDFPDTLPFIAAIAFGWSDEPFRSGAGEFDRRPLEKMVLGSFQDERRAMAESVRLAPSSMNRQPVSLLARDGRIHVFRKHVLLKNPVISYAQCMDVGAAMAHLQVSAESSGHSLRFTKQDPEPSWGNKIYQCTAVLDGE